MRKRIVFSVGLIVFLFSIIILFPKSVRAEAAYKRIKFTRPEYSWADENRTTNTNRIKCGKYYYYADITEEGHDTGGGYWINKVDYYYSSSKKGPGTKMFSSWEASWDENMNAELEFYSNGTYIIKASSNTKNKSIAVYRYNMVGKQKKKLQEFGEGSSSNYEEGYAASCGVNILRVYNGKVYAVYQPSGSSVKIVSFPVKSKKPYKEIAYTSDYFAPAAGNYIGYGNTRSFSVYNMKTGKSRQIRNSEIIYLGAYKKKVYFYVEKTPKIIVYSANSDWKNVKKLFATSGYYLGMKGKNIYYEIDKDSGTTYWAYDVVKGKKSKSTQKKNQDASYPKNFKDRYIYE